MNMNDHELDIDTTDDLEALHRVVILSRYGCYGKTKTNYSKVAFEALHSRYPNSEWTKKTPYWY